MQVAEQAESFAEFTNLSIATITGGVAYQNHGEIFNSNQDIVVATPGRLLQYIKEENFDCRSVEILIFDEADRMLQMGFGQDAEKIAAETRWRKQTLLFSATLEGELLVDFASRLLTDPCKLTLNQVVVSVKKFSNGTIMLTAMNTKSNYWHVLLMKNK